MEVGTTPDTDDRRQVSKGVGTALMHFKSETLMQRSEKAFEELLALRRTMRYEALLSNRRRAYGSKSQRLLRLNDKLHTKKQELYRKEK